VGGPVRNEKVARHLANRRANLSRRSPHENLPKEPPSACRPKIQSPSTIVPALRASLCRTPDKRRLTATARTNMVGCTAKKQRSQISEHGAVWLTKQASRGER
jgi:hypothetical protein